MTDDEVISLSLDDIVWMHGRIFQVDAAIARGRLRDPRALESALVRPAHYAVYGGADLATQAAILAHSIAQCQSFLDGNKRTALIAMTTFLALSGAALCGSGRSILTDV